MKKEWLITFRSVTFAQRAERAMRRRGVSCRLYRTPKHLSTRGCGYCLQLPSAGEPTFLDILKQEHLPYERVYILDDDGNAWEWTV